MFQEELLFISFLSLVIQKLNLVSKISQVNIIFEVAAIKVNCNIEVQF